MTIRELLNSGIEIQGYVKIMICYEDTVKTVHETFNIRTAGNYLDREIYYIYPKNDKADGHIVIEVEGNENDIENN